MEFKLVPLPPSSNNQYFSFVRNGKILRGASKELTQFKKAMAMYWLTQKRELLFAREQLSGKPLSVHIDFMFAKERIFTKKGYLKKLDVSNRLKAIHDSLADALLTDDCFFVNISADKLAVKSKYEESATIRVEACEFTELI